MKLKEIYRSKLHLRDKSHDMCIVKDPSAVNGAKLKMTYECYNGIERFTGELWVGGKWEHTFTLMDLEEEVKQSMYIHSEIDRKERAEKLYEKGKVLFNILND
jgi:hypothetical protein